MHARTQDGYDRGPLRPSSHLRSSLTSCAACHRNPTPVRHPQGNLEDMLEDCNTGIAWVMRHIASRGGDPNRLYIVGQSAGGQLGALTLIAQARS